MTVEDREVAAVEAGTAGAEEARAKAAAAGACVGRCSAVVACDK